MTMADFICGTSREDMINCCPVAACASGKTFCIGRWLKFGTYLITRLLGNSWMFGVHANPSSMIRTRSQKSNIKRISFELFSFVVFFFLPVRLAGVSHRVLILALYRKADASLKKPIVCTIPVRNNLLRPVPISILTPSKRKAISKETINCVLLSVLIWWSGPKWKTVTFVNVLLACKLSVPRLLSPIHLKIIEGI